MSQNQNTNWLQRFRQTIGADKLNTWVEDIAQNTANQNLPSTTDSTATNVRPVYTPPTDFSRDAEDVALNLAATGGRTVTPTNFNQDGPTPRENLQGVYLMDGEGTQGVDAQGNLVQFNAEQGVTGSRVIPGVTNTTPTGVRYSTVPESVVGTGSGGNVPQEGDVRRGEDGQILEFRNGTWQVAGGGRTTEFQTQDPNAMAEVPGADANQPVDKYMESLGVNSLAGQAYQEALARRLASIEEQRLSAGQTYQNMYEQARMSQAARRGMSDVSGMTGGMEQQMGSRMSAAEIASLGQIGMGRESTMRGLEQAELAAPMEAFQEGRAIDEYEIAKQELERSRTMQDTEMQRAETLFEQAQSGWMQNADGTWTNIDRETQNSISLQAINAQQRAEVLGEMQYWQAVLADPTQLSLHESARTALGQLQTRYGELLTNSSAITGRPQEATSPEITPTGGQTPEPEPEPEPEGFVRTTGQTTQSAAVDFTKSRLNQLGITDDSLESPINILRVGLQNQEDVANAIVALAGDKAVEGYNFEEEIQLVNKVLTDPTSISYEEFQEIKENNVLFKDTARYYGVYGWDFDRSYVDGRLTERFMFNDTPQNRELVQYLMDNGHLKEENISVKDGKYTVKSNFRSGSQNEYEKYVLDFSRQSTASATPTTYTGGSAPENPQEGDIWQTPYGKATFKDGRWQ